MCILANHVCKRCGTDMYAVFQPCGAWGRPRPGCGMTQQARALADDSRCFCREYSNVTDMPDGPPAPPPPGAEDGNGSNNDNGNGNGHNGHASPAPLPPSSPPLPPRTPAPPSSSSQYSHPESPSATLRLVLDAYITTASRLLVAGRAAILTAQRASASASDPTQNITSTADLISAALSAFCDLSEVVTAEPHVVMRDIIAQGNGGDAILDEGETAEAVGAVYAAVSEARVRAAEEEEGAGLAAGEEGWGPWGEVGPREDDAVRDMLRRMEWATGLRDNVRGLRDEVVHAADRCYREAAVYAAGVIERVAERTVADAQIVMGVLEAF